MPTPVRVGAAPVASLGRGGPPQQYTGTTSAYGASRGDSVGFNPSNPQAYSASQSQKAYAKSGGNTPATLLKKVGP